MEDLKKLLNSKEITNEAKNSAILHLVKEINKYDSSIECKIKEELINLSKFKYYLSEEECIELYEMYKSKSKEPIYTIQEIYQILHNNSLTIEKEGYYNKHILVSLIYSYLYENGKYIMQISQYMNKNKIVICYHLSLEKIQIFLNENKDNSCLKELFYY